MIGGMNETLLKTIAALVAAVLIVLAVLTGRYWYVTWRDESRYRLIRIQEQLHGMSAGQYRQQLEDEADSLRSWNKP